MGNYEQVRLTGDYYNDVDIKKKKKYILCNCLICIRLLTSQAIADLVAAEERGYVDICSLLLNRGTIYRMLGDFVNCTRSTRVHLFLLSHLFASSGQSNKAADDFGRALALVDKDDKVLPALSIPYIHTYMHTYISVTGFQSLFVCRLC